MEAIKESADMESNGLRELKPEGRASAPPGNLVDEGIMVTQEDNAQQVFQESGEVQARGSKSVPVHHNEMILSRRLTDLQREASFPLKEESAKLVKIGAEDDEEKPEELLPLDEPESTEDYVKKGFKCENNAEDEEDDEQLREHWSRMLQSSSSTGEIVEEIVKVLKHRQKTHDLLCPVCGSCVTKRVILRKRKRSSLISVDRWYRDPTEGDTEMQVHEALTDNGGVADEEGGEPTNDEYEDTEAFGCMACFSLFFQKGQQIWNWVGGDGLSETVNCLPFFFPPYPWGLMNQGSLLSGISRLSEVQERQATDSDAEAGFTCGLGSALVPNYPWGMMHQPLSEGPSLVPKFPWGRVHDHQSKEEEDASRFTTDVSTTLPTVALKDEVEYDKVEPDSLLSGAQSSTEQSESTYGLGPALLPHSPSTISKVSQKSEVEEVMSDIMLVVKNEPTAEAILQPMDEAPTKEASQMLGTDLPSTSEKVVDATQEIDQMDESQPICEDTIAISQENVQPWTGEICACGLGSALLPDYAWGVFARVEAVEDSKPSRPLGVRKPPEDSAPTTMGETTAAAQGHVSNESSCSDGLAPCLLPDYPWGAFQKDEEIIEEVPVLTRWTREKHDGVVPSQNGSHSLQDVASAVLPPYPWGTCSIVKIDHGTKEVKKYTEQETKIEARITSKTDVFTVISTKKGYIGEKLPDELKHITPQKTTKTIESVNLDQTVTVVNASIIFEESPQMGLKGSLESVPSTGFARLDWESPGLPEKGVLTTRPSTGYADASAVGALQPSASSHACLEEIEEVSNQDTDESFFRMEDQPASLGASIPSSSNLPSTVEALPGRKKKPEGPTLQPLPPQKVHGGASMTGLAGTSPYIAHTQSVKESSVVVPLSANLPTFGGQSASISKPAGMDVPNFSWIVEKLSQDDLTVPLLKESPEGKGKTFVSVLEPSGGTEEDQSKFLSVFKVSKPSDDEGLLVPLLPPVAAAGLKQPTTEGVQVVVEEQPQVVVETASQVQSSGLASAQVATDVREPARRRRDAGDGWDILKPIVYGGLDISIASLGVTSSAAGGNAITRTVVYMGLATLLSGLIGFYHNVLNLYHYHKDHYTDVVGVTLLVHGTVALISFVVFGAISPLIYALSYRDSDDRDKKFIRCCIVTIVCVFLLSLGKAKVSNKRYFRTVVSYLLGGVLAAVIGYLAGEHVAELLEEWGL